MPTRFKKKSRKYLGRRRRGYGYMQPRGGGYKGGRGAGIKRSGHKKINFYKYEYEKWLKERKGFQTPKQIKLRKIKEINIEDLEKIIKRYPEVVIEENNEKIIDLNKLGKFRLLGRGEIEEPIKIRVYSATNSAKEKIEAKGGVVETIV